MGEGAGKNSLAAAQTRAQMDIAVWARSRLADLALRVVDVRSRLHMLPEPDAGYVISGVEMLEDAMAEQSRHLLPETIWFSSLTELVESARADAREVAAAAEEIATEAEQLKQALSQERARSAQLQGQLARHCEHRQQHDHVRERVWAATGGKCFYCSVEMIKESGLPHSFVVDHIVPKNAGGPDHLANFIPSCAKCNGEKSDKPFIEFVASRKSAAPVLRVVGGDAT